MQTVFQQSLGSSGVILPGGVKLRSVIRVFPVVLTLSLASFLGCALAAPCEVVPGLKKSSVLDVFPESGESSAVDEATCSFSYQPSGSAWNPGVNEKLVFLASVKSAKWQLGIGKGGQIYSRPPIGNLYSR
jgi:hypothetical protein